MPDPSPSDEKREYLDLPAAAKLYPEPPHPNSCRRHMRIGIKAANGETIKMRHIRVGRKLYTTARWVNEFFDRLTAADLDHYQDIHPGRKSSQGEGGDNPRRSSFSDAEAELEAIGA